MSNGFQFFEGTRRESNTAPRITVRRGGLMVLTPAAVEMLGDGATHVRIGFNPKTKAVGICNAPEEGNGRYRLRNQKNSRSRLVDGKRFFAHHGLSFEKARSFDAEDFGDGLIGFRLPEAAKK